MDLFFYREQLPESPYMYELLGLDLLCLLAQNKVGEFHTTLEHLPPPAITDNVYIRHPVAMEQYLMEGAYNKVLYFFTVYHFSLVRYKMTGCYTSCEPSSLCSSLDHLTCSHLVYQRPHLSNIFCDVPHANTVS